MFVVTRGQVWLIAPLSLSATTNGAAQGGGRIN
jgi:hypothetical protein